MTQKICVIGLGYVGLTLSLALAEKKIKVYGYDSNSEVIDSLASGKSHIFEKDINKYLKKHLNKNFFVTNELSDKFRTFIITVGTPVIHNKKSNSHNSDLSHIVKITKKLAKIIKKNTLLIYRSTLPVGTTRNKILPIFTRNQLQTSKDYFLSYAPERTVEGNAINELRTIPQIIAGIDEASLRKTKNIFKKLSKEIVEVQNVETAEIIKLINNTYRDLSFAYSNQIALICQKYKISAKETINFSNYNYPRNKIPTPSPGVGGPCLSKDPYILNEVLSSKKESIFTVGRNINEKIVDVLAKNIVANLGATKRKKILISGISFKGYPLTKDHRGSAIFRFYKILDKLKYFSVYVDDPLFSKQEVLNFNFKYRDEKIKYDCIVFLNNNPLIKKESTRLIRKNLNKSGLIFDFWSVIDDEKIKKKYKYFEIGN